MECEILFIDKLMVFLWCIIDRTRARSLGAGNRTHWPRANTQTTKNELTFSLIIVAQFAFNLRQFRWLHKNRFVPVRREEEKGGGGGEWRRAVKAKEVSIIASA